ncbi:MAG: hypothetical protein C0483_09015 [Pirellula sp.]|nr:hypothetical protein [Pirellula sp.]
MVARLSPLGSALLQEIIEGRQWVVTQQPRKRLRFMPAGEFVRKDYRQTFIIERILTQDEPAVIGGPRKTLKTSLSVDLAVSIASGQPFLGKFRVPKALPVGVVSGESGGATIKSILRRVCESKEIKQPGDLPISFMLDLPSLGTEGELDSVCDQVRDLGLKVVILDPLYLFLTSSGNTNTANLYEVGPVLKRLCQSVLEAGATPILVHHFRKSGSSGSKPPDLDDLSGAGVAEFARQWLLLCSRKAYDSNKGTASIWMSVGGSAGHSSRWTIDVDEGVMDENFQGRRWDVTVQTELESQSRQVEKAGNEERFAAAMDQLLHKLEQVPEGETKTGLVEMTGLSKTVVKRVLFDLLKMGRLEQCSVRKQAGKGYVTHEGFKLRTGSEGTPA